MNRFWATSNPYHSIRYTPRSTIKIPRSDRGQGVAALEVNHF